MHCVSLNPECCFMSGILLSVVVCCVIRTRYVCRVLWVHVRQGGARLTESGLPVARGSCSWANTSPLPSLITQSPPPNHPLRPTVTPCFSLGTTVSVGNGRRVARSTRNRHSFWMVNAVQATPHEILTVLTLKTSQDLFFLFFVSPGAISKIHAVY